MESRSSPDLGCKSRKVPRKGKNVFGRGAKSVQIAKDWIGPVEIERQRMCSSGDKQLP